MVLAATAMAQSARTVRNVVVQGNSLINTAAITTPMRLQPGRLAAPTDIERDQNEIFSLGFFKKVEIIPSNVGESEVDLLVSVAEYSLVKEIRIEGNSVFPDEVLTKIVADAQEMNQIWNNRRAQPISTAIRKLYSDAGYFVDFEQIGPLDESENTLNIKILETRIGNIELRGLSRTKEQTIRRIMKSRPGDALNIEKLQRDFEELYYTYWFEDLKPSREIGDAANVVNVIIDFKEARTAQINAGVALDPQSRLVGTLSYGDSNFRGLGRTVGVQLEQATVGGGPSATLAYGDRFYDSKDTSLNVRLFSRVVYNFTGNGFIGGDGTEDRFDERRTGFNVSLARPYGTKYRTSIGLSAQNIKTVNLTTSTTENYVQQDGNLISLQLTGEIDTTAPSVEPVQGSSLRLTVEPGYSEITKIGGNVAQFQDLLGSSMFVRNSLQYRQYWSKAPKRKEGDTDISFSDPRPVIAFKAEYGYVAGTVPFFEQLFVGGVNSLRGYPNQRFWGKNSFLATLEYRYPLQRSFNVVGFADYGGAWGGYGEFTDFEQSQSAKLRLGYGIGVAFRTPIGPIRIDFAFNEEGGSRTHFVFGASF